MKKSYISLACAAVLGGALLTGTPEAYAVMARRGVIELAQPDGTSLSIMLFGDEWHNYVTTPDGIMLAVNAEGGYDYAMPDADGFPVASGRVACNAELRSVADRVWLQDIDQSRMLTLSQEKGRTVREARRASAMRRSDGNGTAGWERPRMTFSTTSMPSMGSPRSLVILVEYPNKKFSMSDPLDYFNRFLNSDNFTDNGATGSCRQYFIDNSMGQFSPDFDVYGPVMMKNSSSYYAAKDDLLAYEMVVESLDALDDEVDFSVYDNNGDGVIDNVYIIYAGGGRASTGNSSEVWPHSSELPVMGVMKYVDGVSVNTYGMSNEMNGKVPDGIGTYVHEFSHVLGLPDLYNTVNAYDSSTPGLFNVLDYGSYNNDGRTPPAYSAHERYALNWLQPRQIYTNGDHELVEIQTSNKAYIIPSEENPDEFYLLECRTDRSGWDSYLPGHGMLIWHVNFDQKVWDENRPNNARHYVDLVNADNRQNGSYASDPFPGTYERTAITQTTRPALLTWYSRPLNVTEITEIAEPENGRVTFHTTVAVDRGHLDGVESVSATESALSLDGNMLRSDSQTPVAVYDVAGRMVGSVSESAPLRLAAGLYVADGRKFMVK